MKRAIPLAFGAGLAGAWLMSVCWGSVDIPLGDTLRVLWNALLGRPIPQGLPGAILLDVRLPRTLCVALVGAALSLAGAAMQGLLRNPLADGSTLPMSRLLDLTYNSDAGQAEAVFQLERITDPEQVVSVTVFGETIPVS